MYKTGNVVTITSRYEFVRYTDGITTPAPTAEERVVPLDRGNTFPPVRSANKGAWWRLI